ncbi:DmsC/YnfH family molybdoenzyme membrane anchor subunit [Geothrix sp. PMB-07]|uniref:DmsC/YnfH family molybdoenzyme membrane anchor subunit n=1 Tax=Geothrix sp. PMB-07 TaxID=3068640 RepID=UPI00274166E2|nr:DmsC/YnfH family molybdoenzyme membrane anchor subunit [Geothrix sp. PMB-07]WLT30851.1 DmsC/YnfH family molybdoenzyme membrane anchor subunit [Geothrix sp. PMB-07]
MATQFTFDPNRCTGCQACVLACWMENRDVQSRPWRAVHTFNACGHPDLPIFHLSFACHHCEAPACLEHCPAEAYTKDPQNGVVTIHADRCMGCRYCTWACPHDAPKFNQTQGTIEKCTLCPERTAQGLEPACVARCPMEALGISPLEADRPLTDMPGLPPSATAPGIRIAPLRHAEPPELGHRPPDDAMRAFLQGWLVVPHTKITLRGEWTLLLFTTVISVLVAWMGASCLGGPAVHGWTFLLLGGAVLGLSTAHLGRPERAWRALLHLRTSWLSREVAAVSLFLGLGAAAAFRQPALAPVAAGVGFLALFTVDRLYGVALRVGPWNLHSAHTLFNGLFLLGLLARIPVLAAIMGTFKAALYLHRKQHFARIGTPLRPGLSALRLGLGFLGPLWLAASHPLLAAMLAVLGDLLDRGEYYDELAIPTPQSDLVQRMWKEIGLFRIS